MNQLRLTLQLSFLISHASLQAIPLTSCLMLHQAPFSRISSIDYWLLTVDGSTILMSLEVNSKPSCLNNLLVDMTWSPRSKWSGGPSPLTPASFSKITLQRSLGSSGTALYMKAVMYLMPLLKRSTLRSSQITLSEFHNVIYCTWNDGDFMDCNEVH